MSGWWAGCGSRIFAHRPPRTSGLCVFHTETLCVCHRDTVWCLYSRYIVSIQQIYSVYTADIQVAECQIWPKIMKSGPNQVHMARFGLIFNQNRSHRV